MKFPKIDLFNCPERFESLIKKWLEFQVSRMITKPKELEMLIGLSNSTGTEYRFPILIKDKSKATFRCPSVEATILWRIGCLENSGLWLKDIHLNIWEDKWRQSYSFLDKEYQIRSVKHFQKVLKKLVCFMLSLTKDTRVKFEFPDP